METVLGLIGLAIFIPCVILLAAVMTWAVVRISPLPDSAKADRTKS